LDRTGSISNNYNALAVEVKIVRPRGGVYDAPFEEALTIYGWYFVVIESANSVYQDVRVHNQVLVSLCMLKPSCPLRLRLIPFGGYASPIKPEKFGQVVTLDCIFEIGANLGCSWVELSPSTIWCPAELVSMRGNITCAAKNVLMTINYACKNIDITLGICSQTTFLPNRGFFQIH
jgi:hypothetical protein